MKMNKKLYENDFRHANMKLEKEDIVYDVIRLVSLRTRCSSCCFLNLKTQIQMQSKIMKKRQRKKNNKNVFIPLIPVEMTEEEVKQILKTRKENESDDRRNMHHSTCDGVRVSDELS